MQVSGLYIQSDKKKILYDEHNTELASYHYHMNHGKIPE